MSLQHRLEVQTKHASLLPVVYEKGDRHAWGDMMCHFLLAKPGVYCVVQPSHSYLFSFSFPLRSSFSLLNFSFWLYLLLFLTRSIQGGRAYCQGQRRITETAQCFFPLFAPRMYLSQRGEKRQWVASGTERQRETELIRLISRQKTVGGEMNGERQQNGGSGLCKWADGGASRVYGDKFEAAKVRNEQQKICEIVTQFAVDARNSYGGSFQRGPHAKDRAEHPELEGSPQNWISPTLQLDWLTSYLMDNGQSKS